MSLLISRSLSRKRVPTFGWTLALLVCWCFCGPVPHLLAAPFQLEPGDHVCLVGNALGERMQHQNSWEALLHQSHPNHQLVVRNLCFPGDEPYTRDRSLNFGEPDKHLSHSQASVVLYFFGYNESFAGKEGLKAFQSDLTQLVNETLAKDYGRGKPRVVLITPIAFQGRSDDVIERAPAVNARLEMYTAAIDQVGKETGVHVADVFHPTLDLFESTNKALTIGGCHLNAAGYEAFAPIFLRALLGDRPDVDWDRAADPTLVKLIDDKNFHWWHRYRCVNGFSIYGNRGNAGKDGNGNYSNRIVMERERAILDEMTANRDREIWRVAQGETPAAPIDDSGTLPFIEPVTNVGGARDPNRAKGKLGTLEYLNATEQAKRFDLADGFEIQLVASEDQFPELANPVALNFDNQGRLWVAVMPSYPHWKPKTKLDDKILILEDYDQDGKTDEVKTFVGGLHQPTGFEIAGDGVWIAQQPDVLFCPDADQDDVADTVTRPLIGFDSADSHHGIAAFEWGPGGNLYFQEGTFKYSQVETPDGLVRLSEAGIWRHHPKNKRTGVFCSFAFANPWGNVFNRWGENFIGDASNGNGYYAAPISGHLDHPLKHPGGGHHRRMAHITGGDPFYRFPTFYTKRIRPLSGCAMISSRHFPDDMQGNYLVTNVIGVRGVLSHEVRETGSGYEGSEVEPLLMCRDGNFRPVDIQIAPDGSLYIVDWHNALIGHLQHNLRDPSRDHSHGRIWRLKHKTRPLLKPAKIAGATVTQLLEILKLPEDRTRYRARRELAVRPTSDVMAATGQWIETLDPNDTDHEHHLMEALWLHQTHHQINEGLLDRMLTSTDHNARAAATRVLSFWMNDVNDPLSRLQRLVHDDHPRVRLEAVRAASFSTSDRAPQIALQALDHEVDTYLQYTLDETMRRFDQLNNGWQPIYLDQSPASIDYQVKRLTDPALFAAQKDPDNPKSVRVYEEVLIRPSVTPKLAQDAIEKLRSLKGTDSVTVILDAIGRINSLEKKQLRAIFRLARRLFALDPERIKAQLAKINHAIDTTSGMKRSVAIAAALLVGEQDAIYQQAVGDDSRMIDLLKAIGMVPDQNVRSRLRKSVVQLVGTSDSPAVRNEAITALGKIADQPDASFALIAPLVSDPVYRQRSIAALLTLQRWVTSKQAAQAKAELLDALISVAESTPAAERTSNGFAAAMQLADSMMPAVPIEAARQARRRLSEFSVRLIRIKTVEEEMRYDVPYFAVQAGRPVQIVIENDDIMPHNLVITRPGALQKVAQMGLKAGPKGAQGKAYVPRSKLVLHASRSIEPDRTVRMTFDAPKKPGEYPYVCTFPQHSYRMYGVMIVVKDLEAWQQNPTTPKNPIGSTRSFVKKWATADLIAGLDQGLRGRTESIGKRIFAEASCVQCHRIEGQGGVTGPDLTRVFTKFKNDPAAVLRSILEPSDTIDPLYVMRKVLTYDGEVFQGLVVKETDDEITLAVAGDASKPITIEQDNIELMTKSKVSIMPKALMDNYTKDEIFELLAYLKKVDEASSK